MDNSKILLPRYFRYIGIALTLAGIVFTVIRFGYGIKPDFLEAKVFVVYAAYLQTSEFRFITNNISEEICGVTLLLGLFFLAFSRLKNETEKTWALRTKSFIYSLYTHTAILLFCLLFVYGWGFLMVMTANLILYLLVYTIWFYFLFFRT
ncbi:MAG: hypothetical protein NTY96_00580, partial [Bacteroidetes bacterium]|nr:hypothetical protein [Bacteroidota bacterium]